MIRRGWFELKIVIAGGSGFIGQKLSNYLLAKGHEVTILTRNAKGKSSDKVTYVEWLGKGLKPETQLENSDAIINLAGVSINKGRWSKSHQEEIHTSRMTATDELLRIIGELHQKPTTLINASAIGIYPPSIDAIYTEESLVKPNDFLGETVADWEKHAKRAEHLGVRTVFMRFGVVLGEEGGALSLMTLPYKLFVGGTVGTGVQWVSWVHIKDVIRAIDFAIETIQISGPVNVTAPSPIKMKEFGQTIGSVIKRPHWLPVPTFALKLLLGEKSNLVLKGQYVLPSVLINEGFSFQFPALEEALKDILITT